MAIAPAEDPVGPYVRIKYGDVIRGGCHFTGALFSVPQGTENGHAIDEFGTT
jgi:hypothetical protein